MRIAPKTRCHAVSRQATSPRAPRRRARAGPSASGSRGEAAHRRRHRRDAGQVGHRLVGDEVPVGHRREDERPDQPRAPAEPARDPLVEEVHREEREEDRPAPGRPTGVERGRPLGSSSIWSLWCVPSAAIEIAWIQKLRTGFERNHPPGPTRARSSRPARGSRARPSAYSLSHGSHSDVTPSTAGTAPPRTRAARTRGAGGADDGSPPRPSLAHGPRRAPAAKTAATITTNAAATAKPQSHCGPIPRCPPHSAPRKARSRPGLSERRSESAQRDASADAIVRIVERPEEIEQLSRRDGEEEHAGRHAPTQLRALHHKEECGEAAGERGRRRALSGADSRGEKRGPRRGRSRSRRRIGRGSYPPKAPRRREIPGGGFRLCGLRSR